jgi:hypothetical protein
MCAAVVPEVKPVKLKLTVSIFVTSSIVTIPDPVPGDVVGGDSLGPLSETI